MNAESTFPNFDLLLTSRLLANFQAHSWAADTFVRQATAKQKRTVPLSRFPVMNRAKPAPQLSQQRAQFPETFLLHLLLADFLLIDLLANQVHTVFPAPQLTEFQVSLLLLLVDFQVSEREIDEDFVSRIGFRRVRCQATHMVRAHLPDARRSFFGICLLYRLVVPLALVLAI